MDNTLAKTEEEPAAEDEIESKGGDSDAKDNSECVTESQETPVVVVHPDLPEHGTPPDETGAVSTNDGGDTDGDGDTPEPPLEGPENADPRDVMDRCWKEIEKQCEDHVGQTYPSSGLNSSGWRAVRLFVSSTFQDFFNEREVLVKKVRKPEVQTASPWYQNHKMLRKEFHIRSSPVFLCSNQVVSRN